MKTIMTILLIDKNLKKGTGYPKNCQTESAKTGYVDYQGKQSMFYEVVNFFVKMRVEA